jgi:hypothetical protein
MRPGTFGAQSYTARRFQNQNLSRSSPGFSTNTDDKRHFRAAKPSHHRILSSQHLSPSQPPQWLVSALHSIPTGVEFGQAASERVSTPETESRIFAHSPSSTPCLNPQQNDITNDRSRGQIDRSTPPRNPSSPQHILFSHTRQQGRKAQRHLDFARYAYPSVALSDSDPDASWSTLPARKSKKAAAYV